MRKWISRFTSDHLKNAENDAISELEKLLEDERCQPITYNHYYTDNIQKIEQDSIREDVRQATQILRDAISKTSKQPSTSNAQSTTKNISITEAHIDSVVASLQLRVVVNMDEASCERALCNLDAYYKVRNSKALSDHMAIVLVSNARCRSP